MRRTFACIQKKPRYWHMIRLEPFGTQGMVRRSIVCPLGDRLTLEVSSYLWNIGFAVNRGYRFQSTTHNSHLALCFASFMYAHTQSRLLQKQCVQVQLQCQQSQLGSKRTNTFWRDIHGYIWMELGQFLGWQHYCRVGRCESWQLWVL